MLYALTILTEGQGHALFIDEPVNFVGLSEIQPWLIALGDVCGAAIPQALICSHHPEVLDYIGADRAILLSRELNGPTRAVSLSDRLGSANGNGPLKLSQLMARGWES